MSSFTDTKAREKVVDFVTYFSAGTSFYVKAHSGPTINGLADLCGHTVAVERGTTQATDATAQAKKCKAAGKSSVKVSVFPDQNGANLALVERARGGRDGRLARRRVHRRSSRTASSSVTGKPYGTAPYGIAMPKGSGMARSRSSRDEDADGERPVQRDPEKWGIQAGAITNPQINGATSSRQRRDAWSPRRRARRSHPAESRRTRSGPSRSGTPAGGSRRRSSPSSRLAIVKSIATNPRFEWGVVGDYLSRPASCTVSWSRSS